MEIRRSMYQDLEYSAFGLHDGQVKQEQFSSVKTTSI